MFLQGSLVVRPFSSDNLECVTSTPLPMHLAIFYRTASAKALKMEREKRFSSPPGDRALALSQASPLKESLFIFEETEPCEQFAYLRVDRSD